MIGSLTSRRLLDSLVEVVQFPVAGKTAEDSQVGNFDSLTDVTGDHQDTIGCVRQGIVRRSFFYELSVQH